MVGTLGAISTWPVRVHGVAWGALATAMSLLWRKLVFSWQRYPWRLARVVDSKSSMAHRRSAAREFQEAAPCCLDEGLSRRIHAEIPRGSTLLEDERTCSFVEAMFAECTTTSTYVERVFAHLSRWTERRLSLPSLAGKHTVRSFSDTVTRWRAREARSDQGSSVGNSGAERPRPAWLQRNKKVCITGLSLFRKERFKGRAHDPDYYHSSLEEWKALSEQERDGFAERAKVARSVAAVCRQAQDSAITERSPECGEGPWQLAAREGLTPIAEFPVRTALAGKAAFRTAVSAWKASPRRQRQQIQLPPGQTRGGL
jgi:hypothetical protein